eukprot:jgi/Ulvmu1/5585/UM023_0122.1
MRRVEKTLAWHLWQICMCKQAMQDFKYSLMQHTRAECPLLSWQSCISFARKYMPVSIGWLARPRHDFREAQTVLQRCDVCCFQVHSEYCKWNTIDCLVCGGCGGVPTTDTAGASLAMPGHPQVHLLTPLDLDPCQ